MEVKTITQAQALLSVFSKILSSHGCDYTFKFSNDRLNKYDVGSFVLTYGKRGTNHPESGTVVTHRSFRSYTFSDDVCDMFEKEIKKLKKDGYPG